MQSNSRDQSNGRWVKVEGRPTLPFPPVTEKVPPPNQPERKVVAESKGPLRVLQAKRQGRRTARLRGPMGSAPRRRRQSRGVIPRLPPTLPSSITSHHTFRFSVTSTQSGTSITWANLAGITGVIGTVTNSTVVAMCSSMKIKSITIFPAVNASAVGRQEIFWNIPSAGVYGKDESKIDALPVGITSTAPARFVPPRDTEIGEWFTAGSVGSVSAVLFTVYATAGSIIDLSLSWTHSNNAGSATITGVTTVVLGTYYYLALDGTVGTMPPVGLPTTV